MLCGSLQRLHRCSLFILMRPHHSRETKRILTTNHGICRTGILSPLLHHQLWDLPELLTLQPDPRRDFKIDRLVSWLLWKFQSLFYKTIYVMSHRSWVPSTLSGFQHNRKRRLPPWAFSDLSCLVMSSLICSSYWWQGPSAFWLVASHYPVHLLTL